MHQAHRTREPALAEAIDDRVTWERTTRQRRQLAVAADAELRRCHPEQPWLPLRRTRAPARRPTPAEALEKTSRLIEDLAARHREFTGKLAERQSAALPADDPGFLDPGPALPAWTAPARDAILQLPKLQIAPSGRILERLAARTLDREAAD